MLKVWNMLLVIARVLPLALRHVPDPLGRAQLDPLVHRRARSARGSSASSASSSPASLALVFWRLPLLRARTRLESLVSREATFLYNNLLLVALCLTILWGVIVPAPLRGRARRDRHGRAARTTTSSCACFGLPLLLLMGIGPLVAWRRASLRSLGTDVRAGRPPPRSSPASC